MLVAMPDIAEIRRRNLRRLVTEHEGMNNLARKLGLTKGAYISQLLTDPPMRQISEKTARKWEKTLRLPQGWLDGGGQRSVDTGLLEQVLTAVLDALKAARVDLPPAGLAQLLVMQYTDAVSGGGLDEERIRNFVKLLRR